MRRMLVFRQLSAVLDDKLAEVTRGANLTPQDVLVFAWMEQKPGISGSNIARLVGRKRQNTQASLERLERRGLVQKFPASYADRNVGWGMTDKGAELWGELVRDFRLQDAMLERYGVTDKVLDGLEELITRLTRHPNTTFSPGLIEVPKDEKVPAWDV